MRKGKNTNFYGSLADYKTSVNEQQVDTGGGQSDAVREQLSMGMQGHIGTLLVGGVGGYYGYKMFKNKMLKDPKYDLKYPKQFSPDHPVFGRMPSSEAAMEFDAAKAAENILNKYKLGDYVPEIGGKLTARGKLNLQNTMMNYINKRK